MSLACVLAHRKPRHFSQRNRDSAERGRKNQPSTTISIVDRRAREVSQEKYNRLFRGESAALKEQRREANVRASLQEYSEYDDV